MRTKELTTIALGLLLGWCNASQAAEVLIRDARTGFSVVGVVIVKSANGGRVLERQEANGWGQVVLVESLPETFQLGVQAPGYRSLEAPFNRSQGLPPVIFHLEPLELPEELTHKSRLDSKEAGFAQIHGHVSDLERGAPLEAAEVRSASGPVAYTDARGYFSLDLPVGWNPAGRPTLHQIRVEHQGYRSDVQQIVLVEGRTHTRIALREGDGENLRTFEHRLYDPKLDQNSPALAPSFSGLAADEESLEVITPPTAIKVGFNSAACDSSCCSGSSSCSHVCVFSLEEYVRRGLNDEWIASWGQHSLRSGSVAYRSYGAWFTKHPINGTWDICSSACCQVNDPNTTSATDAAVGATPGILLERQGAVFRSEYSAENNSWDDPGDGLTCSNTDLSCGDGAVGSPVFDWPCLPDTVAAGHGCFGHGRGMSQWGTFRWDSQHQKRWPWIVNHYYNDNGNPSGLRSVYLTSPLDIDTVLWGTDPFNPGEIFTIEVEVTNAAAEEHGEILIGASLYSPSTGYLSDPPNDAAVDVVVGDSTVERPFQLANDIPEGSYDLVVALWLDADEDGVISGEDHSLVSASTTGEPILVESSLSIFADGFESGDTSAWSSVSSL